MDKKTTFLCCIVTVVGVFFFGAGCQENRDYSQNAIGNSSSRLDFSDGGSHFDVDGDGGEDFVFAVREHAFAPFDVFYYSNSNSLLHDTPPKYLYRLYGSSLRRKMVWMNERDLPKQLRGFYESFLETNFGNK